MDLPNEASESQDSSGVSLTLEQSFYYRTYCDGVDNCRDITILKNMLKDLTRQMMIKDNMTKQLFRAEIGMPNLNLN